MKLFQEINIMEVSFTKGKFIQFPTGLVPTRHEFYETVWQNQFHDNDFLEETFSDINLKDHVKSMKYEHYFHFPLSAIPAGDKIED